MAIVLRPQQRVEPPVLLAYDAYYNVTGSQCAPSYQLRMGAAYQATTFFTSEATYIASALARGWTLVVPDFLGPYGEVAASYVEGRNTLDGIRAAENFAPAGLPGAATPTVLFGYSGGSRGSEFAAELAPAYAPELNIRGAATGGLPADMRHTAERINGGPLTGNIVAAAFGIDHAYPELGIA
ncbi:lipase family protein, partial [Nocardia gipuzkoensis]